MNTFKSVFTPINRFILIDRNIQNLPFSYSLKSLIDSFKFNIKKNYKKTKLSLSIKVKKHKHLRVDLYFHVFLTFKRFQI